MALGLLALALFLAMLGRWTADARVPAVVLGNLLAGFAMFALSCRLALATSARPRARAACRGAWVTVAGAVLVAQIALGGLVSAAHAGLSCPELVALRPVGRLLAGVESLACAAVRSRPTRPIRPARWCTSCIAPEACVVLAVLLPLGVAAWRRGHRGRRRAGAAAGGRKWGWARCWSWPRLPLALALAHNLVAGIAAGRAGNWPVLAARGRPLGVRRR